jgi:hypothetical protein
MISVRAETNPPTLIENIELSVIKVLEISIFPGSKYDLQMQLTKSVADALHQYFSIDNIDYDALAKENKSDIDMSSRKKGSEKEQSVHETSKSNTVESSSTKPVRRISATTTEPKILLSKEKSDKLSVKKKRQEGLYLLYMRVGDINLDVSTAGFSLNLKKFKAVMESFFCKKVVLDWKKLIWMLEQHAVWSLTKHTATNMFSGMKLFTSKTPSRTSPHLESLGNEVNFDEDDEEAHEKKVYQLLGVGRSGNSLAIKSTLSDVSSNASSMKSTPIKPGQDSNNYLLELTRKIANLRK